MAVVNCTPDSFSDGGLLSDAEAAVAHAETMILGGAHIVDIGGESTRPGAEPVSVEEELRRVVPVVDGLRRTRPETLISVDTSKVEVAEAALDRGADVVNDVTAGGDNGMLDLVASHGAAVVLMHLRGTPRTMQHDTAYEDVVAEVKTYLERRAEAALAAGIPHGRIWIDPGIGFGKDAQGNVRLLAALPELAALGHPVVIGASRKSFIGQLTGADVANRLPGSLAALIPAVGLQRVVVRVHETAATVQFLEMATNLHEARR
jgi:dihydropteroate synthase